LLRGLTGDSSRIPAAFPLGARQERFVFLIATAIRCAKSRSAAPVWILPFTIYGEIADVLLAMCIPQRRRRQILQRMWNGIEDAKNWFRTNLACPEETSTTAAFS
jgi:hypothetical protein